MTLASVDAASMRFAPVVGAIAKRVGWGGDDGRRAKLAELLAETTNLGLLERGNKLLDGLAVLRGSPLEYEEKSVALVALFGSIGRTGNALGSG
jgi:hypothetical protein